MDTAFDLLGHSNPFPQRRDASPRKCAAGLRASWRPEALGQVDTTHGCSSVTYSQEVSFRLHLSAAKDTVQDADLLAWP